MSKKYSGADILRTIACLFIFFYHCNTILPGEWKGITWFGEDIGNGLFFIISGFGLYPSVAGTSFANRSSGLSDPLSPSSDALSGWRSPAKDFLHWYRKRISKILPPVLAVYVLSFFTGYYRVESLWQAFVVFLYPSLYWFLSSILISYIPYYFLGKLCRNGGKIAGFTVWICILIPFLISDPVASRYFSGLGYMLMGFLIRSQFERNESKGIMKTFAGDEGRDIKSGAGSEDPVKKAIEQEDRLVRLNAVVMLALGIALIMIYGFMKSQDMTKYCRAVSVLVCPVLLIAFCLSEPITACGNGIRPDHVRYKQRFIEEEAGILKFKEGRGLKIFSAIGKMALPLYIVQCFNGGMIGFYILQHIKFPLSFAVNLVVVWSITLVIYGLMQLPAGRKVRQTTDA